MSFKVYLFNIILKMSKRLSRRGLNDFVSIETASMEGRLLDLGCGGMGCGFGGCYQLLGTRSIGVDLVFLPAVEVVADAYHLPFCDEAFDGIICTEVLEHLAHPHVAIGEMQRVLRPGGKLILSTRFIYPEHDTPHDYFRYTRYGLMLLFADWQSVTVKPHHNTVSTFAVLFMRLIMMPRRLQRWLSPFIVMISWVIAALNPLLAWLLPPDYISTGFLLTAVKTPTEER
jgi:SAM-dependent methyltransferase